MALSLDFHLAEKWKSKIKNTVRAINQDGLPLVLFGNVYFGAIKQMLQFIQVDISYVCDNDLQQKEKPFYGCRVIFPDKLKSIYSNQEYNVLILVPFEEEIRKQLSALPKPPKKIFRLDLYFYKENNAKYMKDHMNELNTVYQLLSDEKSRETYQAVLHYWLYRDLSIIRPIALPRNTQYFADNILHFTSTETFLDCGAFIGDTTKKFIEHCKNQYCKILAFEPEESNYKRLKNFSEQCSRVLPFNIGLSDHKNFGYTNSLGMHSAIGTQGNEEVKVDSIDHILAQKEISSASFIKMDIEGFECKALKGAKDTIKNYHPKLAICIYHSIEDMVNVPLLIHKLEPGYSLYLRHYSQGIVETVCYAVYHK